MDTKRQQLLDLLKLNYEKWGSIGLALKHTLIDTHSFVLVTEILMDTIIEELRGQIPEVISIDSIAGGAIILILPFISLASLKEWNLKPILMQETVEGLISTTGKIRQKDNVIILNSILNGGLTSKYIDTLKKYKTNIIEIISLIDPLDGSKEKLIQNGYNPISIFTINNLREEN